MSPSESQQSTTVRGQPEVGESPKPGARDGRRALLQTTAQADRPTGLEKRRQEPAAVVLDKTLGRLRPAIPARTLTDEKTRRSGRTQFTPRVSHFDRNNEVSAQDPFRGFWTLAWLRSSDLSRRVPVEHGWTEPFSLAVLFVGGFRTIYGRLIEQGGIYRWHFAELISEDAWTLALSDAVLVGSTVLCVPFAKV